VRGYLGEMMPKKGSTPQWVASCLGSSMCEHQ